MPNKRNSDSTQYRVSETGLIHDFNSPEADAIIRLQTNIEFASLDTRINCFAVTSAEEAEGKTTMSCNLALLYAEKGLKVCLVDLDIRQPSIHKLFHLENKVGIVEYVKKDVDSLEELIHNVNGVDIISAGSHTPFPTKVLASERMKQLIAELKKEYDYVIIDTPPILVVSDAFMIGLDVDGFIVVCSQHISKKKAVKAACQALTEKNINIIGIAMTMVTSDEDAGNSAYGNGYGYGYGYGYSNKSKGYASRGGYGADYKRQTEVEDEEEDKESI